MIVWEILSSPHDSLMIKIKTKITISVLNPCLTCIKRLFGCLTWFDLLLYLVFYVVFLFVCAISEPFVLAATKSTSF